MIVKNKFSKYWYNLFQIRNKRQIGKDVTIAVSFHFLSEYIDVIGTGCWLKLRKPWDIHARTWHC